MKIVIGSSMKFRSLIKETMSKLKELGFTPLFPNLDYSSEDRDVALSIEEKNKLALDHYCAVEEADAVYFILPEGYMGTSCKIELGYALALKKPVFFSEITNDIGLDGYPKRIISLNNLEDFKEELRKVDVNSV
jgi:nucleoside 2-deoxyribosyltransferase